MAWRKSTRRRRSRNCTGTSGATNSRMSAPAENAFSPAPVTTTTLTSSSTARASKQRVSSRRMASFIALWTSGRFSVSVATCSATSYTSVSYVVLTRGSSGTARSSDDLAGAEPRPRGGVVAGGAEHLVGVVAERWRGARVARRRLREEQRRSRQRQAADLRMIVLARQPVMPRQRMAAKFVDRVHGAGRDIVRAEHRQPGVARPRAEARLQNRQQHLAVVEPQHPGGEAGIVREVLELERLAQLDPERLVAAGEEEPFAVAGLVEPIGRVVSEDRLFPRIVDEISGLQGRHRVQQRRLHLLADAAALADEEGREHRLRGERRRVVIDERDADILRRTAEALERHDASHALQHRVEPRAVDERPGGAEGRSRAVDEAWVEGAQPRFADAQPVGHARAHVLHDHVGVTREPLDDGASLGRLEVDGDRALAAVPREEAGLLAGGIALERLDLDYVGVEIGEPRRRVVDGDGRRQVDDANALERSGQIRHRTLSRPRGGR